MYNHKTKDTHRNIRIAQHNMQGAKVVGLEIRECVDRHNIDILCMQEPYTFKGRVGGMRITERIVMGCAEDCKTAISIHNENIDVVKLTQFCDSHCTCVEIQSNVGSFYLINIYAQYSEQIEQHLDKIEQIITDLGTNQSHKKIIITGDFNARSVMWHDRLTDDNGKKLEDFISRNGLFLLNENGNPPTFSSNGSSNIDITLINGNLTSLTSKWQVKENWTASDHRVIVFELLNTPANRIKPNCNMQRYALKTADWGLFAEKLIQTWANIESLPRITSQGEIDGRVDIITNSLTEVCKKSIRKKKYGKRVVGWWNNELRSLKSKMHLHRRQYQSENDNQARIVKKIRYQATRNKYFDSIKMAKENSFQRYVTEHGNNDPWGLVYKYNSGKIKSNEIQSSVFNADGVPTVTWVDTRAVLLDKLLPDDIPNETIVHSAIHEPAHEQGTLFQDPSFTWEEVTGALKSLKRNKAPGTDNINVEIIQNGWPIIGPTVITLLNSCLKYGYFPAQWKAGEVIVIRKPGDRDPMSAKSYRPIMLLPVLGKLFEKLIAGRITPRVEQSGIFSNKQYGFRSKMSTEDALVQLVRKVNDCTNKYVMGIFLDISGAFDNLTWNSIIASLSEYNLPSNLLNIMKNYFQNRTARISDKHISVTKAVTKGCPQGSIIGPLVWNIVFNKSMIDDYDEIAFADDKVILVYGNSRIELERKGQIAIDRMTQWCHTNKMSLSAEKTVLLQLKGKFDNRRPPKITLNNCSIKMVKTVRYLGVDFDERMGTSTHVKRICENAKKVFHSLTRVSREGWGLRHGTLVKIYKGVAEALFTYAAAGWAERINCHHIRSLESAQRNILLRITRAYRTTSKEAVNVLAGVFPVDLLIKKRVQMYNRRNKKSIELGNIRIDAESDRSLNEVKTALDNEIIKIWQHRWDESDKGRHAYEFIPNIMSRITEKIPITESLCQVITGHGKFKDYLHRFQITESCRCECNEGDETVDHLLYECKLHDAADIRENLIASAQLHNVDWPIRKDLLLRENMLTDFQRYCATLVKKCKERNKTNSRAEQSVRYMPPRG